MEHPKMNYPTRWLFSAALVLVSLLAVPVSANPVDDRLAELFDEYHDVSTGTFREVQVEVLLKRIKEIASFHEAGFTSLTTAITCLRYRFVGTIDDPGASRYGFVLYATRRGSAVEKHDVIAAQITYIAPSNAVYYRNVSPLANVPPNVLMKMMSGNPEGK
jgi:hypothetical protein